MILSGIVLALLGPVSALASIRSSSDDHFMDLCEALLLGSHLQRLSPMEYRIQSTAEFYIRSPERTADGQQSTVINTDYALNEGFILHVNESDFWISKDGRESTSESTSQASLPNSILVSGKSKWLFAVFNANNQQIDIYGVSTTGGKAELKYLFRIWLFGEDIASPPFLSLGPSISYKDAAGHINVFWFDTFGSGDVEPVYRSEQPVVGDISGVILSKSGRLVYMDEAGEHSVTVFPPSEEWRDYVRRLEGDAE